MGDPRLTGSCVLYTHNITGEQGNLKMNPGPNRLWDSSNPLIQECKCRWKCASLTTALHKQAPPVSAAKRDQPRSLSSPQISPTSPGASPCSWAPLWPGHTPCVSPGTGTQQLSPSANALQHPDLPSLNHSLGFSLQDYPEPQTSISVLFVSGLFGPSVQADGMVQILQQSNGGKW